MPRYNLRDRGGAGLQREGPAVDSESQDLVPSADTGVEPATSAPPEDLAGVLKPGLTQDEARSVAYAYIMRGAAPQERLSAVQAILHEACNHSELLGAFLVETWALVERPEVWKGNFSSAKEARNRLDTVQLAALRSLFKSGQQRKSRAITSIQERWPSAASNALLFELGEHHLEKISRLAARLDYDSAVNAVVRARDARLRCSGRGRTATRTVTAQDFQTVCDTENPDTAPLQEGEMLSRDECRKFNIDASDLRVIIYARGTASKATINQRRRYRRALKRQEAEKTSRPSSTDEPSSSPSDIDDAAESRDGRAEVDNVKQSLEARPRHEAAAAGQLPLSENPIPPGTSHVHGGDPPSQPDIRHPLPRDPEPVAGTSTTAPPPPTAMNSDSRPSCPCQNIPQELLHRVRRLNRAAAGMDTDSARVVMLDRIISHHPDMKQNFDHVCHEHIRAIGAHLGLRVKLLNRDRTRERVRVAYAYRNDLSQVRTQDTTYQWFRKADRPIHPDDRLGIYAHPTAGLSELRPITAERAHILIGEAAGGGPGLAQWLATGNLIINNMFSWVWQGVTYGSHYESGIGDLVDHEFLMYEHHQRERNGAPNRGWLRTMVYSLIQQLIRTDLQYYLLYTTLRPDHNYRLISYPYYTKFARAGDSTYFRHIDMNIPRFLESRRGENIIQGSVSIDAESMNTGCTEIVPGMHKRLDEWWEEVCRRAPLGKPPGKGLVHDITPLWLPSDAEKYGEWTRVPCDRGAVRITQPHLPHGSTTTTTIRRTILPWFVGINPDGKTLDTLESGTWQELSLAHLQQEKPPTSPSGHSNMYGAIPYRFPAATHLRPASAVSQALVGAATWADPAVLQEAGILLGDDRAAARDLISAARLDALIKYKSAYQTQVEAEIRAFGQTSYYRLRGGGGLEGSWGPRCAGESQESTIARGPADIESDGDEAEGPVIEEMGESR